MRARSALVVASLVALSLVTATPPARGAQHLMKVREVYAGSLLEANADFVELQMYQNGQQVVGGHPLTLYNQAGASRICTIPQNVTNGANQETILLATSEAQAAFGTADFTIPAFLEHAGGAVCFENFDCASWGSFAGAATAKDRDGGPGTPEPGGIPIGDSLDRRIDISGGATTLENEDDTNNSANDFEAEDPSPNANGPIATNLGTATCTPPAGEGDDVLVPSSRITAPKHKTAVEVKRSRNFQGTASDKGGSGLAKVEVALRMKRSGGCKWWNGSSFVGGGCSDEIFVQAGGTDEWSYSLGRRLKPTGRAIRTYILYSRATDGAGNTEAGFVPQSNKVRFGVFKPPITCGPKPC
jgi:hypothetical protein